VVDRRPPLSHRRVDGVEDVESILAGRIRRGFYRRCRVWVFRSGDEAGEVQEEVEAHFECLIRDAVDLSGIIRSACKRKKESRDGEVEKGSFFFVAVIQTLRQKASRSSKTMETRCDACARVEHRSYLGASVMHIRKVRRFNGGLHSPPDALSRGMCANSRR